MSLAAITEIVKYKNSWESLEESNQAFDYMTA